MTGTLLQERLPQLNVYGTLDQPLHARNLTREMIIIKNRHPRQKYIAIDAAVGEEHEIGRLQLRNGPIYPGKATAKSLPAVGDYALTAILEKRGHKAAAGTGNSPGFAAVYHMAKIVQQAVADWYDLYPQ